MEPEPLGALARWVTTPAAHLLESVIWMAPALEILHFIGMAVLVGVVAMLDLQVLGYTPGLRNTWLRPLLPWAIGGFLVNLLSGGLLVAAAPQAFINNLAFRLKMLCILLAGANALWSQLVSVRARRRPNSKASTHATRAAKLAAALSLLLWCAVIAWGRLIPFLPGS